MHDKVVFQSRAAAIVQKIYPAVNADIPDVFVGIQAGTPLRWVRSDQIVHDSWYPALTFWKRCPVGALESNRDDGGHRVRWRVHDSHHQLTATAQIKLLANNSASEVAVGSTVKAKRQRLYSRKPGGCNRPDKGDA